MYKIPERLQSIVQINYECPTTDDMSSSDSLLGFKRKVDKMLICVFYGLYHSRSIPFEELFNDDLNYEGFVDERFNVNINESVNIIRNLMLMLWLIENNNYDSRQQFRDELYEFLEHLLDDDKFIKIIIPYYLKIANTSEGADLSFIKTMYKSAYSTYESNILCPEHLALRFLSKKGNFMEYLNKKLDDQDLLSFL